jgi:hypothetical protein
MSLWKRAGRAVRAQTHSLDAPPKQEKKEACHESVSAQVLCAPFFFSGFIAVPFFCERRGQGEGLYPCRPIQYARESQDLFARAAAQGSRAKQTI